MTIRMVPMMVNRERYLPLVRPDGRILTPREVHTLSATPLSRPTRRLKLVVADESTPRTDLPQLELAHFSVVDPLPIELGDSGCPIGLVERLWLESPGAVPETVGRALLAVAHLAETALADIVWSAIEARIIAGACVVAEGSPEANRFVSIRLGDLESSCLAGARILDYWEEPPAVAAEAPAWRAAQSRDDE